MNDCFKRTALVGTAFVSMMLGAAAFAAHPNGKVERLPENDPRVKSRREFLVSVSRPAGVPKAIKFQKNKLTKSFLKHNNVKTMIPAKKGGEK